MAKPIHFLTAALVASSLLYGGLAYTNAAGPPTARTGAPGELSCTNCHGGTARRDDARFQISLAGGVQDFGPGDLLNVHVEAFQPHARNGFELTALQANNTAFGTLSRTDATNTSLASTGGKQYVRHTTAGNRLSSWDMAWQAPAVADTSSVYFYAAGIMSNSNNRDTGDSAWVAKLRVPARLAAVSERIVSAVSVRLFPNPCTDAVHAQLTLAKPAPVTARLYDTEGILVQERTFLLDAGSQTLRWQFDGKPAAGTYILRLSAGGYTTARSLVIQ